MPRPCNCDKFSKGGWTGNPDECYDCWRYHNVEKFRILCDTSEPSLLEKAGNLTKAIAKHVFSGFKKTSDEQFEQRINICKSCPFYIDGDCKKCGCKISLKAAFTSQKCPIDLWPVLSDGKKCGCGS